MFTNILIPVDGSEQALRALDVACDLATKYGATLRLVHAYGAISTSTTMGATDIESAITPRVEAGQAVLDQALERVKGCAPTITTELREAPAAEAILEEADTHHCDLIVMGTRGLGQLQGLLVGSVSQKIVQQAKCPVLLTR